MEKWKIEERSYEDHGRGLFFEIVEGSRVVATCGRREDAERIVGAVNAVSDNE